MRLPLQSKPVERRFTNSSAIQDTASIVSNECSEKNVNVCYDKKGCKGVAFAIANIMSAKDCWNYKHPTGETGQSWCHKDDNTGAPVCVPKPTKN